MANDQLVSGDDDPGEATAEPFQVGRVRIKAARERQRDQRERAKPLEDGPHLPDPSRRFRVDMDVVPIPQQPVQGGLIRAV